MGKVLKVEFMGAGRKWYTSYTEELPYKEADAGLSMVEIRRLKQIR